jgi:drug/metabolite transporter (DMT)-like permease
MWILFALTSATILASRKIQEKKLVSIFGQSLWWMVRLGSALSIGILWIVFSRDMRGFDHPTVWIVVAVIALIMYPLQTYTYYRAMKDMPLSLFGMLSPIVFLSSIFFSYIFFGIVPTNMGYLGILLVSLWVFLLLPEKRLTEQSKHLPLSIYIVAISSYALMWLWWVMDKVAMAHIPVLSYALLNQIFSAISMMVVSFFLYKWLSQWKISDHKMAIFGISFFSGIGWFLWVYAIQESPNVSYAIALINMHALFTTIYGVLFFHEGITWKKICAWICMMLALLAFAFA